MEKKLALGDTVHLKSGGPAMTLSHRSPDGRYIAIWFVGEEVRYLEVDLVALEIAH